MKKIQSIETLVSIDYKGNKKGLLCCKDCCLCNRNTSDADIDTMFIVEHKNGNNISA